jgi:hypothetical protein
VAGRGLPAGGPRRTQDRAAEERAEAARPSRAHPGTPAPEAFANEAGTDFTLLGNRAWLAARLAAWRTGLPEVVPAVVDGERFEAPPAGTGIDPSAPAPRSTATSRPTGTASTAR